MEHHEWVGVKAPLYSDGWALSEEKCDELTLGMKSRSVYGL